MKTRHPVFLSVLLMAFMAVFFAPQAAFGSPDDETTEDVIYMVDGRELHGQIVEETDESIVFKYIDRKFDIRTTLTLKKNEIAEIKRDVEIAGAEAETGTAGAKPKRATTKPADSSKRDRTFGAARTSVVGANALQVYLVPMEGQVGTDIISSTYKEVIEDIKTLQPDVIVFKMNCEDLQDNVATNMYGFDATEIGILNFEDSRKLIDMFKDDVGDIRQVMWIHDSLGISSTLAMAWADLYMASDALLGGLSQVLAQTGADQHGDEDKKAKMMAAWLGNAKAFLVYGGYPDELAEAMMMPNRLLSADWRGRDVNWYLNKSGTYIVDPTDKFTVTFPAKIAENLCISDGTADTLDDLALLLGYREYNLVDGIAESHLADYRKDWRRAYQTAIEALENFVKYSGWAGGDEALKYLGRAKKELERVVSIMRRFPAVELRLGRDHGVSLFALETKIEELKEQLRAMRQRGGGGGTGGRRPAPGGGVGG